MSLTFPDQRHVVLQVPGISPIEILLPFSKKTTAFLLDNKSTAKPIKTHLAEPFSIYTSFIMSKIMPWKKKQGTLIERGLVNLLMASYKHYLWTNSTSEKVTWNHETMQHVAMQRPHPWNKWSLQSLQRSWVGWIANMLLGVAINSHELRQDFCLSIIIHIFGWGRWILGSDSYGLYQPNPQTYPHH